MNSDFFKEWSDEQFFSWLAGFWEGEGSLVFYPVNEEKGWMTVSFSLNQKERHILDAINHRLKMGKVHSCVSKFRTSKRSFKPNTVIHRLMINGFKDTLYIIEKLLPHLTFRKNEVQEKLEKIKAYYKKSRHRSWNDSELKILKESLSLPIRKQMSLLPDRTFQAIKNMRRKIRRGKAVG